MDTFCGFRNRILCRHWLRSRKYLPTVIFWKIRWLFSFQGWPWDSIVKHLEEKLGNKIPALHILATGISLRILRLRPWTMPSSLFTCLCLMAGSFSRTLTLPSVHWAIELLCYRHCFRWWDIKPRKHWSQGRQLIYSLSPFPRSDGKITLQNPFIEQKSLGKYRIRTKWVTDSKKVFLLRLESFTWAFSMLEFFSPKSDD